MSQQQGTRVMVGPIGPTFHFEEVKHRWSDEGEVLSCAESGCTPADPHHPDTVRFIQENKEA